jgi:hypothetical protein
LDSNPAAFKRTVTKHGARKALPAFRHVSDDASVGLKATTASADLMSKETNPGHEMLGILLLCTSC